MKSGFVVLLGVAFPAVLLAAPAAGADDMKMQTGDPTRKDTCLLVAMNCANETDTIQQRIERLHNEIGKGTAVYTADELDTLHRELLDEQGEYRDLMHPGGEGHHRHSGHVR